MPFESLQKAKRPRKPAKNNAYEWERQYSDLSRYVKERGNIALTPGA